MRLTHWILGLSTLAVVQASTASTTDTQSYQLQQAGVPTLSAGLTFTDAFDVALLHSPGADTISSAVLTLNFVGAAQKTFLNTSTTITGSDPWTQDSTSFYSDALDGASVLLSDHAAFAVDDSAGFQSALVETGSTTISHVSCGTFGTSCVTVIDGYFTSHDQVSGYAGSFSFTTTLNESGLRELNAGSLLHYGFTVTSGALALDSAMLSLSVSAVPEPLSSAMWLAGMGLLAGLRMSRRRAYRNAAASATIPMSTGW